MKTAAICLLLCVLIFVPAAFADSITSIAPSAFNQGDIEQFIEIQGTGLVGDLDTQVVMSGPFGTTTVEASPGAPDGTILFVSIPDFVLSVPGTVSVTVLIALFGTVLGTAIAVGGAWGMVKAPALSM